jgi:hypothetical protein
VAQKKTSCKRKEKKAFVFSLVFEEVMKKKISLISVFHLSVFLIQILICHAYLFKTSSIKSLNIENDAENENILGKILVNCIKNLSNHTETSQNDLEMVSWLIDIFKMKMNKRIRDEREENTVYWHLRQG